MTLEQKLRAKISKDAEQAVINILEIQPSDIGEFATDVNIAASVAESLIPLMVKMHEALQLYADRDNWTTETAQRCSAFTNGDHEFSEEHKGFNAGKRARLVQKEIEEALK